MQEGVDRFREALESLDLDRVQRQLVQRRKRIEKQLANGRRTWERRTRKQVKRIQTELRKNSLVKRVQSLQEGAARELEERVDGVLSILRIASRGDVDRLDRKLGQIHKKLRDLERTRRSNGEAVAR